MTEQKFIPALGYDFLSEYYDLTIRLTMPEKKLCLSASFPKITRP